MTHSIGTEPSIISKINDRQRGLFGEPENEFTVSVATPGVVDFIKRNGSEELVSKIRSFDNFNEENDPYGEHDSFVFDLNNKEFFFKIDYYSKDREHGSEDPADESKTTRVMTVMRSSEY